MKSRRPAATEMGESILCPCALLCSHLPLRLACGFSSGNPDPSVDGKRDEEAPPWRGRVGAALRARSPACVSLATRGVQGGVGTWIHLNEGTSTVDIKTALLRSIPGLTRNSFHVLGVNRIGQPFVLPQPSGLGNAGRDSLSPHVGLPPQEGLRLPFGRGRSICSKTHQGLLIYVWEGGLGGWPFLIRLGKQKEWCFTIKDRTTW